MGIPTEPFEMKPDDNLICVICHDVLEDPASFKCGHTFCNQCIENIQSSACPTCRTKNMKRTASPSIVLKNLIGNLVIRCKHHPAVGSAATHENSNNVNDDTVAEPSQKRATLDDGSSADPHQGCSWTGKVSDWPLHAEKDCPLHEITCSVQGCGCCCARKDMDKHMVNDMTEHVNILVDAKVSAIAAEFDTKLEAKLSEQKEAYEEKLLVKMKSNEELQTSALVHSHLTTFCRQWSKHKPDALADFVVYRPDKITAWNRGSILF